MCTWIAEAIMVPPGIVPCYVHYAARRRLCLNLRHQNTAIGQIGRLLGLLIINCTNLSLAANFRLRFLFSTSGGGGRGTELQNGGCAPPDGTKSGNLLGTAPLVGGKIR